jgi:hypothetical protein
MHDEGTTKFGVHDMHEHKIRRAEITIETLSVTTIKKRETAQHTASCSNCGHEITTFNSKQTEPVIADNPKMIVAAKPKTGEES